MSVQSYFEQTVCSGAQIFNAKNCPGDNVTAEETKLLQIINDYRAQNKLPQVPISKPLSIVANRHLLDIQKNLKSLTHSWSDCVYNFKDDKTWNCVTDAPKRLNVDFKGHGYENLFRTIKIDAHKNLNAKNRELLITFVNNVFPNSRDAEKWFDENIVKIMQDPQATKSLIKDGKVMQIRKDAGNYLILTAKPYSKTSAVEY